MKISILLPYKENFSIKKAGAVSLYVRDITKKSKFKKKIKIYGETKDKVKLLNNFVHLDVKNKFFLSKTNAYINEFINKEKRVNSDLIEIHNRPSYVDSIKKNLNSKIIIYFHNDPLTMKGSISIKERKDLLNKCEKIIFNSKWCKSRFVKNIKSEMYENKTIVIPQSTSKVKINFKNKKKIISFVGKLNTSKGYDSFGKAIIKILNEFSDWSSIVIGDEPREKLIFNHKRLKLLGFKSNKFILNKLKEVSISVVPSKWNEPFGRSSLEASSRGCALITSNRGGLAETTKDCLVISDITDKSIYKKIKLLIKNVKLRKKLQKSTYKNFFLTNNYVSKLIDSLRKSLNTSQNIIKLPNKNLKILHVTNLNERFDGRLHYNTGKRINNGFIRLGHNVLSLSDRDIIRENKSLADISGIKTLNKRILNTVINFKPDIVVLGHADNISVETIISIKKIYKPKICQWFLDPLIKKGPDYEKNKKRITKLDKYIDATFVTTHPDQIFFKLNKSYFIPNPCDESFEYLDNSKSRPNKDLFFAMSHGVHRGVLKGGKHDDREMFLKKLKNKISNVDFDVYGMNGVQPIWGEKFLNTLSNYKMGLNLSRGKPVKYYSSDRIVQLIGNGLLTFIDKRTKLNEIISSKGVVYYSNFDDLVKKINFFKNKNDKIKKISSLGKKEYFKKFNSKIVSKFIIEKSFNINSKFKYHW